MRWEVGALLPMMFGRSSPRLTLPLREGQNREAVLGRGAPRGDGRDAPSVAPPSRNRCAISTSPRGEVWVPYLEAPGERLPARCGAPTASNSRKGCAPCRTTQRVVYIDHDPLVAQRRQP
jgi:hypothetical protein